MTGSVDSIVAAVAAALGSGDFGLHDPSFGQVEQRYVRECIESSYVSSVGAFVDKFERGLEDYTGAKHAVATVNGTAALHVALQLAGVREGDEVLVPALTFVATANAVRYCNAIPHFLDINEATMGIDPTAMESWLLATSFQTRDGCVNRKTKRRIAAVVPVHAFGHPCDVQAIKTVAAGFGIQVVEDAAESLGSLIDGQHTGTFGVAGTLSFNGNKIVTSGGGGAILTNDTRFAEYAKHLTTTAKLPHVWEYSHDEVGFNYRMPNINAALGLAQLERVDEFIASKRQLFVRYKQCFENVQGVRLVEEPVGTRSNYWLQTLVLDGNLARLRDVLIEELIDEGYVSRPAWQLISRQRPFIDSPKAPLPVAESIQPCIVNVPSGAFIP